MEHTLRVSFVNEEIKKMYEERWGGRDVKEGLDLICAEGGRLTSGQVKTFSLGVRVKPPEGYRVIIRARSSCFSNCGAMLSNGVGVIDPKYCGPNDILKLQLVDQGRQQTIKKGDSLCQLFLEKIEPITDIKEFKPSAEDRGGFGSTGKTYKKGDK